MSATGTLDKRSSLIGAFIGLLAGGIGGFILGHQNVDAAVAPAPVHRAPRDAAAAPVTTAPPTATPVSIEQARPSFAQQGEDLVMAQMMETLGIKQPTYLDVGAHDPIANNNTYMFYALGGHGVLVEPNPVLADKLRKVRPKDVVLEVGVGVTEQTDADYFVIAGDGQLNTFSKKQAETLAKIYKNRNTTAVLKRSLVKINDIIEKNFKASPDILSIDVEGLDYEILKSIDWKRWRPRVICVETAEVETGKVETKILELLQGLGYAVRGGSFVNTIFLDERAPIPSNDR
jgi:FkbM family methyltransferase